MGNIHTRALRPPSKNPELRKTKPLFPSSQALLPPSENYRTCFPTQDLEEEVAELFYDMVKDFPELTFGMIEIKNAFGGFHVILDSVLVFKKVCLHPIWP